MESDQEGQESGGRDASDRPATTTRYHLEVPVGITAEEYPILLPTIARHHSYTLGPDRCSSLLVQRVQAPLPAVWSLLRRFDTPQCYKHFIKSCSLPADFVLSVGTMRDVTVVSGLPATTSRERLDVLDDQGHVTGFTIVGGEHRLRNYKSVTTAHEVKDGTTVVLESYVVDVPEGNTEEDTRLFADTVVRLNLQKLATVAEGISRDESARSRGQ
ncbi:hypothetical protein MLD38_038965 [Melastoma candidum]|uniref:Uncharacterized protein n=1 Tax=Melastoma candidum TaxID=119954 RepID=A0ACB9L0K8_9MYRT|nr:hypothetical protein MLD38_038965 [Melastoma candidum]